MEIDITALCRWIKLEKYEDASMHFPQASIYPNQVQDPWMHLPGYRTGVIGPDKLPFGFATDTNFTNSFRASVRVNRRNYSLFSFHDQDKLLAFLNRQYGEIEW